MTDQPGSPEWNALGEGIPGQAGPRLPVPPGPAPAPSAPLHPPTYPNSAPAYLANAPMYRRGQSGKATAVQVLGILSLVLLVPLFLIPFLGWAPLVLAIVALSLAPSAKREIAASNGLLSGERSIKAGVICSWVSVGVIAAVVLLLIVVLLVSILSPSLFSG